MRTLQSLAWVIVCAGCIAAGAEPGAVRGVQRTDRNSRLAHEQLMEKAKKGGIDLYFAGDSITRRWGTSDRQYKDFLANWKENFHGWNAGNFGWGGDTAANVLWRVENGELDGVRPKVIVLMAGTNDVGGNAPAEEVVGGIKAILEVMRAKAPEATIIVMGITPRKEGRIMPVIGRVNEELSKLADGKKVRYLNINDKLADGEGKLIEGMTVDGLHLSANGYQVWADGLRPVLTELLGARGKTDHAPEPTGDPSAQGH